MDYTNQQVLGNNKSANESDSLFRAIVVNNQDPLKLGRVQLRIPSIYTSGMSDEDLPWATPCYPTAGADHGTFITPEIGDTVFVLFENSRKDKPVYIGCTVGAGTSSGKLLKSEGSNTFGNGNWNAFVDTSEAPDEYLSNNNCKVIYKSPKGAVIYIDESDGNESINIVDRLGQIIRMSSPVSYNDNGSTRRRHGNVADDNLLKGNTPGSGSILIEINSGEDDNINTKILLEKDKLTLSNGIDKNSIIELSNKLITLSNYLNKIELSNESVSITANNIILNGNTTINGKLESSSIVTDSINTNSCNLSGSHE